MKINHSLMDNNFTKSDMNSVRKLISKKKYNTNSIKKSKRI